MFNKLFNRTQPHCWMPLDLNGKRIKCTRCGEVKNH